MASQEPRLISDPARTSAAQPVRKVVELDAATIRFAGDTADGVHLIGAQFTSASAAHGNYVCTQPDPPAEIRAPAGTLAGVSGFQVQISKHAIHTPGDRLHLLVAMNPAALKANLGDLEPGGILVVNSDACSPLEWQKAGYATDPLDDGTLTRYRLASVPMDQLNRAAVANVNLNPREVERCKSFFALGLVFWLYDRPLEPTLRWIRDTFAKNPAMVEANTRALDAGYHFAEAGNVVPQRHGVAKAIRAAGRYRQLGGIDALALALLSAAQLSKLPLVFASFPTPPAGELLQRLSEWKQATATAVQADDDLAALNMALGASFGGALGVTAVSSPGFSLLAEPLGLAVMSELPCIVIDVQRAGPSTGMPSRSEQADLLMALYGRHGECPLIVLAAATPADGFEIVLEAARLAVRCMTPVIVLTDAYLAQTAETWRVPELDQLPTISAQHAPSTADGFLPYQRNTQLARPWAIPGTPGLEHRTGGLEKEDRTGNVSYDPDNHERMVQLRAQKIARAAEAIPPLHVDGPADGDLLVLGWGSTFGAITAAAERCRRKGTTVANAHLRHLLPMPKNMDEVLKRYRKILVPELNSGQLAQVLRASHPGEIISLTKIQGRPFSVSEIESKIDSLLRGTA